MSIKFKDLYEKFISSSNSFSKSLISFVNDLKVKFKDLYHTNYNIGIYHLEKGNLWDAAFRFKTIKKFWPNELDAQCKYALCLILKEMNEDAELLLNDILKKDPNLEEAKNLLEKIKNGKTHDILRDYNEKIDKQRFNLKNISKEVGNVEVEDKTKEENVNIPENER